MCKHGDEVVITGSLTGKRFAVDRCIVELVAALNHAGITTVASCCGHGETVGTIALHDGRELLIVNYRQARAVEALIGRDIHGNELPGDAHA